MAKLLEGKPIADQIKSILKSKVQALGKRLKLSSVQVGINPASTCI